MSITAKPQLDDTVLSISLVLAVAAAVFLGVSHSVNAGLLDWSVDLLNADYDHSVFGWGGEVATFAGVPGALLLAGLRPARRGLFLLLAATLSFLSLDDAVFIHERIAELDTSVGLGESGGRLVWPLLYLPVLSATLVMMIGAARELGGRLAVHMVAGAGLLVVAVVLEASSYGLVALGYEFRDWPFVIEVVIEEGAELAGWILCAGALTAGVVSDVRPLST